MKLFVLGAGFSKALSPAMPVLADMGRYLAKVAAQHPRLKTDVTMRLVSDPELLLSYLYQEMPWKTPEQYHWDRGDYLHFAGEIARYITQCEERAFLADVPDWADWFVDYLHRTRATVATLNYDTVLERLSRQLSSDGHRVNTASLYRLPLTHVAQRTLTLTSQPWVSSYRLLKLHGSINWFYMGMDTDPASQTFYVPVTQDSPFKDGTTWVEAGLLADLVPLIIPPVADKASFYRSHLVQMMWAEFWQAAKAADSIFFIGYSLPKTDLTMRLLLSAVSSTSAKRIYPVNSATGHYKDQLLENYREVFAGCEVRDTYLGRPDAIKLMTEDLTDCAIEPEL